MTLTEKAAYLKGMLEGMEYDTTKAEGKLIGAIVDLLTDITEEVSELEETCDTLHSYAEELDEDLGAVEDVLYDDEDCCGDDCCCHGDDEDDGEKTLRGSSSEVSEIMQNELSQRVADAGLVIEDVRITTLAYSDEIAAAMLQRQQAFSCICDCCDEADEQAQV